MKRQVKTKEVIRKCLITKKHYDRKGLIRIVKTKTKEVLLSDTVLGRGFYLVKDKEVIKKVIKKKLLNNFFKDVNLDHIYEELEKWIRS